MQNDYQQAILTVGNILEPYDADKKYPVFGFGAKIREKDGTVTACKHDFPLVRNNTNIAVGISGILEVIN